MAIASLSQITFGAMLVRQMAQEIHWLLCERSNTFTHLMEAWGPGSDDALSQKTQELPEFWKPGALSQQWWLGGTSGDL